MYLNYVSNFQDFDHYHPFNPRVPLFATFCHSKTSDKTLKYNVIHFQIRSQGQAWVHRRPVYEIYFEVKV